tara:strand:+ start:377 stop:553 length:177 start_codon:yes stop_codon:yes gene_type:complete
MMNPTLSALLATNEIVFDAIKVLRALRQDGVADILLERLLETQKNIYGGDPASTNGGN